jgi:hypothetical protein
MKPRVPLLSFILLIHCSQSEKTFPAQAGASIEKITKSDQNAATKVQPDSIEDYLAKEKVSGGLSGYNGKYFLNTKSKGAEGILELKYKGNKIFNFSLSLRTPNICRGDMQGEIFMDKLQHGFYSGNGCILHFNFKDDEASGEIVVQIEQPDLCNHIDNACVFSGHYISKSL